MREFFRQCMKDLESLTGIRQLFFLLSDEDDGARKYEILLDGMVAVSSEFDYITEKEKQQIIRRMMVQDQTYDALNARVIYRWLSGAKDAHTLRDRHEQSKPPVYADYVAWCEKEGITPLPEGQYTLQPSSDQVSRYADQLKANLARIGRVTSPQPFEEKGYEKSLLPDYLKDHLFTIEGIDICAQTEEGAREIYMAKVASGEIKPKVTESDLTPLTPIETK